MWQARAADRSERAGVSYGRIYRRRLRLAAEQLIERGGRRGKGGVCLRGKGVAHLMTHCHLMSALRD